jgi:regulator of protease activity HflC (stomatin/prohibitin superfamily)
MEKLYKTLIHIGIAVVVLIFVSCTMVRCTRVDSSEVGIKFNKLSLTDQGTLDAATVTGYVFYCPITTDVFTYETRVRSANYKPFIVQTKDGSKFEMDPNLNYRLIRERAIDVFAKYRKPLEYIEENYMRVAIYDAYRINANKYTADELIAHRADFEDAVKSMLDSTLSAEGFYVEQFTSQIEPPKSLVETINAKNAAVQSAQKAENEVKKAEAEAKIAVAKAEGEAKAMRVKADAEAYYNRTISASLSRMIVQEDWIEKWDGHLPKVQGGNNMMPILNMGE